MKTLKTKTYHLQPGKGGFITLMSVIITSAIGIAIASAILLLGVGSAKSSIVVEQSSQAKNLATACAEDALERIKELPSFTGLGNLSINQGNCSYSVTNNLAPQSKMINATGTVSTVIRKVNVTVTQINPKIRYTWQEF
ncbi:MAG: hypothetical protein AAB738_01170 [Patescibacteria group bacterium]